MSDRVVVRVPATVANLGPGFDAIGMAVGWHNQVTLERADELVVTASGFGASSVPRGPDNLCARAVARVLGQNEPRVRIHQMLGIAFGRGFGSSAASIVGGLVAARALAGTGHSDEALLALATEIEGHADNVAPCLLGGVTVSSGDRTVRLAPPDGIRPLLCVAPTRMSTSAARGALPASLSRADAVFTLGRVALLVAALSSDDAGSLLEATDDRLHQPARFELMPDSADLVRALRSAGIAAFLSGAGPSVSALVPAATAEEARKHAVLLAPDGWEVRLEGFDASGAVVVEER